MSNKIVHSTRRALVAKEGLDGARGAGFTEPIVGRFRNSVALYYYTTEDPAYGGDLDGGTLIRAPKRS